MKFSELVVLTDESERQLRWLIANGFVPRPGGTRTNPEYGQEHVDAVRLYQSMRDMGLPPAAVRALQTTHQMVPLQNGVIMLVNGEIHDAEATERIIEKARRAIGPNHQTETTEVKDPSTTTEEMKEF